MQWVTCKWDRKKSSFKPPEKPSSVRARLQKTTVIPGPVRLREQDNRPRRQKRPRDGEVPFLTLPPPHGELPLLLVEVLSGRGKRGRIWQASTHLLEPVPSIVSANNSLPANLWISSGSLHAFTILLPQLKSPSLLFTALWAARLFLCTPCKKVSRKEKRMSTQSSA